MPPGAILRRWYVSKRALLSHEQRGLGLFHGDIVQAKAYAMVELLSLSLGEDGEWKRELLLKRGPQDFVGPFDVSRLSGRAIDRLARDWIGHGVGPCCDGRRGVCAGPPPKSEYDRDAWRRAERRAARVVSR